MGWLLLSSLHGWFDNAGIVGPLRHAATLGGEALPETVYKREKERESNINSYKESILQAFKIILLIVLFKLNDL